MLEESNSLSDLIHPKTKPFDRNGLDGVNWCEARAQSTLRQAHIADPAFEGIIRTCVDPCVAQGMSINRLEIGSPS
jgi:hypothetical protein